MSPAIAVTVLLPLVPVIASTFGGDELRVRVSRCFERLREELDVADDRHAALRSRRATGGSRRSMPGLIAIRSAPRSVVVA